ncbi:MAG: hypothetical protein PHR92_18250 [Lachnospiraceae bacterium]|nr:hypothetical protein [Lachnospiraceae bacterium]
MKIKVIKRYNDLTLKAIQEEDTELDVSEQRAKYLVSQGMAEIVKEEPAKAAKAKTEGKEQ